jgi:signal transduction histidine kinase
VERLPAEHPAAPRSPGGAPGGRQRGDQDGPRGGATAATVTLSRPPVARDAAPAQETPDRGPGEKSRAPRASGSLLSPRNWKVRTKLAAVLLVPAVAFLVLASINMAGQISSARDYGRGATLAEFGRQTSTLVHELQAERDIASGFITSGRDPSNQADIAKKTTEKAAAEEFNSKLPPDSPQLKPVPLIPEPNQGATLQSQQANVDSALTAYRGAEAALGDVGPDAKARIAAAGVQLDDLTALRAALARKLLTQGAITGKYTSAIEALLAVNREIGQGSADSGLTTEVNGVAALSDLKETLSQERALLYGVGSVEGGGRFQFAQQQEFAAVIAERQAALQRFRSSATPNQAAQYDTLVNGQSVLAVKRLEDSVVRQQSGEALRLDAQQWYQAATTYLQAMRVVEAGLLDQVVTTTRELRSDAQRQAITTGVVIAAILVIAFLTSLLIARSMIGPLRRLQLEANDVARVRLPEAIARLQRPDATSAPPDVQPIGIDSRDEIGEVARQFDELHREAVRLATEQAGLRRNVNDMFVNLSRRSQGLVERQLKLIDELETGEQDPDQLANLFKLDHLATRMRRNSENLLVLAGEDAGRRWGRPIPLVDVLRAATSEVEQYHRIQLTGVPDVEVMGHAVNHLVHLVAELLENATVFSSPESKVLVHSQRLSDGGAMVEIEDRGIGMSAHEISDSNERLARPPEFDVSVSRMMGLYVVGRLATRHGITVRLRQAETGGVSAFVRIPIDVLASRFEPPREGGDNAGAPPSAFDRQMPDTRPPARPGPALPAAPAALGQGGPGQNGGPGQPGGPRPLGPGPAADLPRRPLARPDQPSGPQQQPQAPGLSPLPRRTPTTAGADGADGVAVNGIGSPSSNGNGMPNGIPTGRPVLPPAPAANGNGQAPTQRPPAPQRPDTPPAQPPRPVPSLGSGSDRPSPFATRPPAAQRPAPQPAAQQPAPQQSVFGQQPAAAPGPEESTPIYEQLQSEWFRQRPAGARQAPQAARPAAPAPAVPAPAPEPAPQAPAAQVRPEAPAQPVRPPVPVPAPAQPADDSAWASPADEGWRAAERLLQPSSGGTTRAGLPMRVPQAHLMPGGAGADGPTAAPPEPQRPAYRSPEAVRSRLSSYHQGVRRGRHADRAADNGDNGERDPSEVLVQQSQEQS